MFNNHYFYFFILTFFNAKVFANEQIVFKDPTYDDTLKIYRFFTNDDPDRFKSNNGQEINNYLQDVNSSNHVAMKKKDLFDDLGAVAQIGSVKAEVELNKALELYHGGLLGHRVKRLNENELAEVKKLLAASNQKEKSTIPGGTDKKFLNLANTFSAVASAEPKSFLFNLIKSWLSSNQNELETKGYFPGTVKKCRNWPLRSRTCCHNRNGWLVECNEEEKLLLDKRYKNGHCIHVGDYDNKLIGQVITISTISSFCCYNTPLGKAVHLKKPLNFGSPQNPNCQGIERAAFEDLSDDRNIDWNWFTNYMENLHK